MDAKDNLTVTVPLGKNEIAKKALYLVRSLRANTEHEIYSVLPVSERKDIDEKVLKEIKELSDVVVEAEIPKKDYPISFKIEALSKVQSKSDNKFVGLLDADTLVLDNIEVDEAFDIAAKPVDVGQYYWSSKESEEDWKKLYRDFEFDFPEERTYTTVDNKKILPYYNAGVILVDNIENEDFAKHWLQLTKKLHGSIGSDGFADQVALALISSDMKTVELTEKHNLPLPHRIKPDPDTKVIHYHYFESLVKYFFFNTALKKKVKETGILKELNSKSIIEKLISDIVFKIKRYALRLIKLMPGDFT